jgi:hypothetical protein
VKTSELTGAALNLMVATAMKMSWWTHRTADWDTNNGYTDWVLDSDGKLKKFYFDGSRSRAGHWEVIEVFEPSTDWSQGGPITEREVIATHGNPAWTAQYSVTQLAHHGGYRGYFRCVGPTPLIAAMRCFVASKLGDEVDVPEELTS